jgi:hypothetical protein
MARYLFDKYLENLISKLETSSEPLELEVRLDEASYSEFQNVFKYLENRFGQAEITHTEDFRKGGVIRQTLVTNKDGTISHLAIEKKPILKVIDADVGYKIALSSEVTVPVTDIISEPDLTRIKHRYSWQNSSVRYDLTKVTQTEKGKEPITRYEVELEMISSILESRSSKLSSSEIEQFNTDLNRLSNETLFTLMRIQNTDMLYKKSVKNFLANFINEKLNANNYKRIAGNKYPTKEGEVAREIIVQARDLKLKDILSEGILKDYSVTIKAEGLRKLLVIHSTGVWLVFNSEFCKISELPQDWKSYENTILDGEDIPPAHRNVSKEARHYYLPFDTLLYRGKDVTSEPLKQRLEYTKSIRSLGVLFSGKIPMLITEEKPFYFFNTPEQFYSGINSALRKFNNKYENDGLIFTPFNTKYNSQSDRFPLRERVLSKHPDICKWKPQEKLSIDLAINISASHRGLYANKRGQKELVEFKGSNNYPFDPETQIDWFSPFFKNPNGTILEFAPKTDNDKNFVTVNGRYILTPIRSRPDKLRPNGIDIANDVWENINIPIKLSTLKGEDILLMRKYHNRIKKNLLKDTVEGSLLVDIGSGNGGDIAKWGNFTQILAIEPDSEHIQEFERRLKATDPTVSNKIHLLQSGGENTDKILTKFKEIFTNKLVANNEPVPLYISMMLSLSFFFSPERNEMLKALTKTIKSIKKYYHDHIVKELGNIEIPNVKFIFLTIEAERTLLLAEQYDNRIRFPGFEMDYHPNIQTVSINIPGSIVENQTEYLVDLDAIQPMIDVQDGYVEDANKEAFLNQYEKQITSMYVYGSFTLSF